MKATHAMNRGVGKSVVRQISLLLCLAVPVTGGSAVNMSDYTNYPMFLNKTGPTNILFIVDLGNAQLPAAYGSYPISAKNGTVTVSSGEVRYASNVNLADTGRALVSSSNNGATVNSATTSAPSDVFNPSKEYYGIFDPYRCYTAGSPHFVHGSKKVDGSGNPSVSVQCATSYWDGNFLNWLGMRKKEVTMQALIGGKTLNAQSNTDGTADTMSTEGKIGENGSNNDCSSTSKACWAYVKWVPVSDIYDSSTPALLVQGGYTGRVPTNGTLTADTAGAAVTTPSAGRFFGLKGGTNAGSLVLNVNNTVDPFDGTGPSSPLTFQLSVNLNTEPDSPGTGPLVTTSTALTDQNCNTGDDYYAGARACYKRERSLGLLQKMRKDLYRPAVLFADNVGGVGGYVQFRFDEDFNASTITNIRNALVKPYAPLAEAAYEGLCLYRNEQGACYSNSPADFTATTGARYDPFWVCDKDSATGNCKSPLTGQLVPCCKSFILMISPGIPTGDGNNPNEQPFGNLMNTGVSNVGLTTTQLDDVAYYGRTQDIRNQSNVPGVQNVTFYAVNAMGGAAGAAVLASAAKWGGFEDRNNDNAIDLAGTQACTYPVGSPLGSGTSTSNPEWDKLGYDSTTDSYVAVPDCIPDTYFSADEGGDLEKTVNRAIADIMKRSASGTAISVLASSATGDGTIYQAYFFPQEFHNNDMITWTGYVQGLWVDSFGNLREDNGDHRLVYDEDPIIENCVDSGLNAKFIRYPDTNGNGKKDDSISTPNCDSDGVDIRSMNAVWEAGKKLALRDIAAKPRKLFTWVDLDNDGIVDSGEQIPFDTAGSTPATLAPYLRATATGTFTSTNIINFMHGNQITGMRNRMKLVDGELKVWRLGDVINSTPTIVGAPRERFDILYGDQGYRGFAQRWKNRRITAYVGANDGMLHAFNGGYFPRGDAPGTTAVEQGYYTKGETADDSTKPQMGEEVWGFIPYYLLPQIRWLAETGYTHVSYVDLKPKVTEVNIFTEESDCGGGTTPTNAGCKHPGGWGTVLILGLKYGGSCKACTAKASENNGGPALTVKADFNGDGDTSDTDDTREFLSGYIVLDITDPDVMPTVLTAFTSSKLGLTTSYPTVVRMSPSTDSKTDHSRAKFMVVVGSGQHGYDGRAASGTFGGANLLTFQIVQPGTVPETRVLPVGSETYGGFMGDPITYDRDLDFRSDVVYAGRTIDPSAGSVGYWWGKFYRLTMGTCSSSTCLTDTWGVNVSGNRVPSEMVMQVTTNGTTKYLGPVTAGATVTLDSTGNTWVFFGTGRFFSKSDKTDLRAQYLLGVKDSVMRSGGCTQTDAVNCTNQNLLDVSTAQVCISCASSTQVQNVSGVTTFSGLLDQIQGNSALSITAKDGWVIELQSGNSVNKLGGERSLVNPRLIGGALFFPTFVPSTDVCVAAGDSYLYAMYYLTGTGHTVPVMGTDANGMSTRKVGLGQGLASSVAIQIGSQPTGMAGFYQSSNSTVNKVTPKPISSIWSQYMSWVSVRD